MSSQINKLLNKASVEARALLQKANINAIPIDVFNIAKYLGIRIIGVEFPNEDMSGLIKQKSNTEIPVIAYNKNDSEHRIRFTIAHEIGHFILHTNNKIFVDSSRIYFRNQVSSKATDIKEIQANKFASELLVPKKFLLRDLEALTSKGINSLKLIIKILSNKYNVSEESMSIRLGKIIY